MWSFRPTGLMIHSLNLWIFNKTCVYQLQETNQRNHCGFTVCLNQQLQKVASVVSISIILFFIRLSVELHLSFHFFMKCCAANKKNLIQVKFWSPSIYCKCLTKFLWNKRRALAGPFHSQCQTVSEKPCDTKPHPLTPSTCLTDDGLNSTKKVVITNPTTANRHNRGH